MAVAVDDHVLEPLLAEEAPPWTCPVAAVKPTAAGQPCQPCRRRKAWAAPIRRARSRDRVGGPAPPSAVARIRSGPDIALRPQPLVIAPDFEPWGAIKPRSGGITRDRGFLILSFSSRAAP